MIPPFAHLIWLGGRLSALAYLTARSALARGGFETVTLHHDTPALADDPFAVDLLGRAGFALARLDMNQLAARDALPEAGGLDPEVWDRLITLDRTLPLPSSRSNLSRLALLWLDGGVYLDTDFLVLRDFAPLRAADGFAGADRICFPLTVVESRNPLLWARAGLLTALRSAVCRLSPHPSRTFHRIEHLYFTAADNAALGAVPGHPFIRHLLEAAAAMEEPRAYRRFRLGSRLLQEGTGNRSRPDFVLHDPATFYPLSPEVSREYVRDDPDGVLGEGFDARTYAAHLYDSVLRLRVREPLDAAYFRRTRGRTLLTRMAEPYLDDLLAILGQTSRA